MDLTTEPVHVTMKQSNKSKLARVGASLRLQHTLIGASVLGVTLWLLVMTIVRGSGSYYERPITVSVASTSPTTSTVVFHVRILALAVFAGALFAAERLAVGLAPRVRERYAESIIKQFYMLKDEKYSVSMARSVSVIRWIVAASTYPFLGIAIASLAGITDLMLLLLLGAAILVALYIMLVLEYLNARVERYKDIKWIPAVLASILSLAYHGVVVTYVVARFIVDAIHVPPQVGVAVFASLASCVVFALLFLFRYTRHGTSNPLRRDVVFDMAYTITEGIAFFVILLALSIPN